MTNTLDLVEPQAARETPHDGSVSLPGETSPEARPRRHVAAARDCRHAATGMEPRLSHATARVPAWALNMRDRDRGLLIMLFGVVAITPDSLLVRLMQLDGGSTVDQNLQSIFWKYALTAPLISGFSVWHSGGLRKLVRRLKRTSTSGWRHIVVGALCQVCISISLNLAFVYTKAARALLFFGLNPLWAAFIARLVLGQAVPARTLVALLLVTCAICVVFMPEIVPSLEEAQNQTGQLASDASSVEPTLQGDLCGVSAGAALGAMIVVSASAKKKCPEVSLLPVGP